MIPENVKSHSDSGKCKISFRFRIPEIEKCHSVQLWYKYGKRNGKTITIFQITSVTAGNSCMSATNESGRLFIWGENRYSSLGLGHSNRQLFPYQLFLPGDVRQAALGPDHSLFLVN